MNKIIFSILQRVLVNHFYKVNTGFFLFFFFVLFGVVSGGQLIGYHLSLIHGMIQSFIFLGCVIVLWLLYTFKCINYITKQLSDPRQHFLSVLNRLPESKQFLYLLFVHVMVYLPVFIYTIIVAAVAAHEHYFASMAAVVVSNVIMIIASAFIYKLYLQKRVSSVAIRLPFVSLPKPFFSIPLWFILKERKQMLLVTKLFSFLLLYAFINIYEPGQPDIRPILLIMVLVVVGHSAIVAQIRFFEEERLLFTKNLPIPFFQRLGMLWLQYFLLLVPEFIFMWKGFPLHFQITNIPQIVLLPVALASFLHGLLLMKDTDMETYYRMVFGIWAILFFVLLYNPGILLGLLILAVAASIYHSHLYDFEKKPSLK